MYIYIYVYIYIYIYTDIYIHHVDDNGILLQCMHGNDDMQAHAHARTRSHHANYLHDQLVAVDSHDLDLVLGMQAQIFERPAAVLRAQLVLRVLDQRVQNELDTVDLSDFDLYIIYVYNIYIYMYMCVCVRERKRVHVYKLCMYVACVCIQSLADANL